MATQKQAVRESSMGNKVVVPSIEIGLDDGEQILEAIRSGCVDAFVVEERDGHTVYTLQNVDLPYSSLVQRMQQGAAMLHASGEVVYCNPSLAALLRTTAEFLIGTTFQNLVAPADRASLPQLLQSLELGSNETEVSLRRVDDTVLPAKLSLTSLSRDNSVIGLLVTDLTTEKSHAELASRIQQVQDEERRGIARELHDSVGQLLAALNMNLASVRKEASNLPPSLSAMLDDSAIIVEQVSKEIRTISHLLHPPLLDVAGLCSAIRWYVDGFSERSHIQVELHMPGDLGRLPSDVEIAVFRVVQECLTNVYRHSGSTSCSVHLEREQDTLRLEIRDSGHGMPKSGKERPASGVGLRGMQERLRQLGGTLELDSSETGTTVVGTVPVTEPGSESRTGSENVA